MTISKRQFELLHAMNIPLWVSKPSNTVPLAKTNNEKTTGDGVIDLATLVGNQLFNDILITIGLSSTNAVLDANHKNSVQVGEIYWQFSDKDIIDFNNNHLIIPSLQQLETSPRLKRQLWQLIIDKELICP